MSTSHNTGWDGIYHRYPLRRLPWELGRPREALIDARARALADSGVSVSPRVGGLRLSPHFYNTMDEVDVFLEKLNDLTR